MSDPGTSIRDLSLRPQSWVVHKGSLDLAPKPSKGQSPAEQVSGSISKDREMEQDILPGTWGPLLVVTPGRGSLFPLKWRQ